MYHILYILQCVCNLHSEWFVFHILLPDSLHSIRNVGLYTLLHVTWYSKNCFHLISFLDMQPSLVLPSFRWQFVNQASSSTNLASKTVRAHEYFQVSESLFRGLVSRRPNESGRYILLLVCMHTNKMLIALFSPPHISYLKRLNHEGWELLLIAQSETAEATNGFTLCKKNLVNRRHIKEPVVLQTTLLTFKVWYL